MTVSHTRPPSAVVNAMFCSSLVAAQFVAGKAARDALFLARLEVTSLPLMLMATAVVSIAFVAASSRGMTRFSPIRFVPLLFAASAALFVAEWILTPAVPRLSAILVYFHVSALGPILGSGFWLIVTESFDPRTAKQRFGQIAGAGTLGGLAGGLLAERTGVLFGVPAVLPFLALLNIMGGWTTWRLASGAVGGEGPPESMLRSENVLRDTPRSGLRVLADVPYVRHLAALVLLGTMSAALVDYLFKVQAVGVFGRGENLLRFFAIYYAATSLLTFVVQTSASQFLLQRFGLALATSLPSFALFAGSALSLVAPGFSSLLAARGAESISRGSLFRFGYELFYTPIPAHQKRAVKSIIDVGFDRLGDAVGGGIIRLVIFVIPALQHSALLGLAIAGSGTAIILASRLNRGYIQTLENSLLNRAVELDLSDALDFTTRTTVLRTFGGIGKSTLSAPAEEKRPGPGGAYTASAADPEVQEILWLRSRDRAQVVKVLRGEEGLTAALVPHVIPLLAWSPVADDAMFALRKVAEERVGELVDALVDPNQDFAVRRRLARVFSICVSQRAADGLMLGLDDQRFEVRFQCGRSLASIAERNPRIRIDRERVLEVILREVAVGRPVWESRRVLDGTDPGEAASFVDELVRDRAGQSLAHVFTLLSLVLPREPLLIAFRGLQTGDQNLRGTSLEYLEGVLPAPVRERLWPFLEDHRQPSRGARPSDEILADLLRSNKSIMVNLEALKQRDGGT